MNSKRTRDLLSLTRNDLRQVVSVLTGHWTLRSHGSRLGLSTRDYCRSCESEEELETVSHLLCDCPALARTRFKFLGNNMLGCLNDVSNLEIAKLVGFIKRSGWLEV